MGNPFRDKTMRGLYEDALRAHDLKLKMLFLDNGERRRQGCYGSSFATHFWHGYDGRLKDKWDRASRTWPVYAAWCAGRDVRKRETV